MSPDTLAVLTARLASPPHNFWNHWGFELWAEPPFAGVCRVQRFVKNGFLGNIAEYRALETILWESGTDAERALL